MGVGRNAVPEGLLKLAVRLPAVTGAPAVESAEDMYDVAVVFTGPLRSVLVSVTTEAVVKPVTVIVRVPNWIHGTVTAVTRVVVWLLPGTVRPAEMPVLCIAATIMVVEREIVVHGMVSPPDLPLICATADFAGCIGTGHAVTMAGFAAT